jgi:hypothetical protein
MQLNADFRDLLSELNSENVDYLIVGAYAMGVHGMPRYTGDIDILYRPTPENVSGVLRALRSFGYTSLDITPEALLQPDTVMYLGHPPARIDLLNAISGVTFDEAWDTKVTTNLGGIETSVLSLSALAKNKKSTGRTKDLVDLELIEKRLESL